MFIRAGGSAVCRARPIVIMIWERAEPKNQLDLSTGLDWIGSATNRLLKPPNHAAISHAFEAVQEQCSANKPAAVAQDWRHPVPWPCASPIKGGGKTPRTVWPAAVLCVSGILRVRACLSTRKRWDDSFQWLGRPASLLQGQTCVAGVRIRPDVIVGIRLKSEHRQTTVRRGSTKKTRTLKRSNKNCHSKSISSAKPSRIQGGLAARCIQYECEIWVGGLGWCGGRVRCFGVPCTRPGTGWLARGDEMPKATSTVPSVDWHTSC